jgi:hypothetical protein
MSHFAFVTIAPSMTFIEFSSTYPLKRFVYQKLQVNLLSSSSDHIIRQQANTCAAMILKFPILIFRHFHRCYPSFPNQVATIRLLRDGETYF